MPRVQFNAVAKNAAWRQNAACSYAGILASQTVATAAAIYYIANTGGN